MINYFYTGFLLGYLGQEKIIEWADSELMSEVSIYPEEWLMKISLCDNYKIFSTILNEQRESVSIFQNYLSLFRNIRIRTDYNYNSIIIEVLKCFNTCNDFFTDYSFTNADEKYNLFFTRLSDYISLKEDRLPVNMDMPREMDEFLSNYHENIQIFKDLDFEVCGVKINSIWLQQS